MNAVERAQLPAEVKEYLHTLIDIVRTSFDDPSVVVGVYLFGSGATNAYQQGISDLDAQVVLGESSSEADKTERNLRRVADRLSHRSVACPAQKLELVIYTQANVADHNQAPRYSMNYNTGASLERDNLSFYPNQDDDFWFVLDVSMGIRHGLALYGPAPSQVFATPSRDGVIRALADCARWHSRQATLSANAVLNAARSLRWLETGEWVSKEAGGLWVSQRERWAQLADEAIRVRKSTSGDTELRPSMQSQARELTQLLENDLAVAMA